MPEGPSLVILKEELQPFISKRILEVSGSTKVIDKDALIHQRLVDVKTWGKHLILCLDRVNLRIHFLLFGKNSINQQVRANPGLHLHFANGDVYFYTASIHLPGGNLNDIYDWKADVMNDDWDPKQAKKNCWPNLRCLPAMHCLTRTYLPARAISSRMNFCGG
jgi:endonuclease-8